MRRTQMLYLHDVCFNEDLLRMLSNAAGLVSGVLLLFIFSRTVSGLSTFGSRDSLLNLSLLAGLVSVWYMARHRLGFSSNDRIQIMLLILSCIFMHKILATFTGKQSRLGLPLPLAKQVARRQRCAMTPPLLVAHREGSGCAAVHIAVLRGAVRCSTVQCGAAQCT